MAGDSKAFNEVRALLTKLERSIDEARSKRVGPKENAADRQRIGSENHQRSRAELDREIGGGKPPSVPESPLQAKRAQYGRARPLTSRPDGDTPQQSSGDGPAAADGNGWKSPKNYDDMTIG